MNFRITIQGANSGRGIPCELTNDEQLFYDSILKPLFDNPELKSHLLIDKRSDNYKTVSYAINHDFLRFKIGVRSKWFSIFPNPEDKNNPLFECVKNKRVAHWKIPFQDINDVQTYYGLIENAAYFAKMNFEKYGI